MDVGIRYGDGRWPDLKSTFLLRDAFFPVCSPALLEGMHSLRGGGLKHHTLIRDRSMASEGAFPTWRTWLQAASFFGDLTVSVGCNQRLSSSVPNGDLGIAASKNWICTEAKGSVADVARWRETDQPSRLLDVR
jgi:hypothetical protein